MTEKLLTVDEISEALRVPKSWTYRKAREKEIPLIKVGKYLRFRLSEVLAWLEYQD